MSVSKAASTQPKTFREKVILYFNDKMSHKSIKGIKSIENQRADWLQARVKEHGRDAIFQMIDKAAESSFLNGDNKKGFVATFDWLMRPNNFPKVLEGNYDNRENGYEENRRDNESEQRRADAFAIMRELAEEE